MQHLTPTEAAAREAEATIYRAQAAAREAQLAARKTQLAAAVAALRAEHPELEAPTPERDSLVTAAANLRRQLKARWPGIKFSVRIERFSMGDALRVSWTDGPTTPMVDELASRYKAGNFDGYSDCYEYACRPWTEAFGDAKYVTLSRNISPALEALAKAAFGEIEGVWPSDQPWWRAVCENSIKRLKK